MTARKILTVGVELASADAQYASFRSKMSLLDWDVVLFKPDIAEFTSYGEYYQGKPSLSDSTSFQLKECCEHWRREIKQAVETGKHSFARRVFEQTHERFDFGVQPDHVRLELRLGGGDGLELGEKAEITKAGERADARRRCEEASSFHKIHRCARQNAALRKLLFLLPTYSVKNL